MSEVSDTITAAEGIGIAILIYLGYKAFSSAKAAATEALTQAGYFAVLEGPPNWVQVDKPLTAQEARSIAVFIGIDQHGGGYSQSPDGKQVWFYDGSFYDNPTAHYFDKNGVDLGYYQDNNQNSSSPIDGLDTSTMDLGSMVGMSA